MATAPPRPTPENNLWRCGSCGTILRGEAPAGCARRNCTGKLTLWYEARPLSPPECLRALRDLVFDLQKSRSIVRETLDWAEWENMRDLAEETLEEHPDVSEIASLYESPWLFSPEMEDHMGRLNRLDHPGPFDVMNMMMWTQLLVRRHFPPDHGPRNGGQDAPGRPPGASCGAHSRRGRRHRAIASCEIHHKEYPLGR